MAATKAETPTNIYQIISTISKEAGALAPEKAGGVPFAFRGVDQVVGHLAPLLDKYGVITVPTVLEHRVSSAPSGNKVVTTSEILTRFAFFAPDGTSVEATTAGLANDYADRSAAQAQSVAYRVALLQTFHLPTHSPEPEQTGIEREAPKAAAPAKAPAAPAPVSLASLKSKLAEEMGKQKLPKDPASIIAFGDKAVNGEEFPDDKGTIGPWHKSVQGVQKVLASLGE